LRFDYSISDIETAVLQTGIKRGDCLFMHSNIGFLGKLAGAVTPDDYYQALKSSIFKIIGDGGTLIVPTFSYSFCNKEVFNIERTPGVCGLFSEMLRKDPESLRSHDANFSIAAIGCKARYFTDNAPEYSFGKDSFWERFLNNDGLICNINFDAGSTFIHYVEREIKVPYRWDKPFAGAVISVDKSEEKVFYHFVYDLNKPENAPDFTKFAKQALELGKARTVNIGRGQLVVISARDTFTLIEKEIKVCPSFLIKGNSKEP
jgi:aminoglycoside 3-N-acetyltransferase